MEKDEVLFYIYKAVKDQQFELNLSRNQLTSLPPEIRTLNNLKKLDLSGNKLASLPPEIGELTKLSCLNLSGNQLTSLPPGIERLTNLTTLDLFGNQLTALPPEIGKLTNINWLYLSGNQLTSLPPEIGNLTKITELDLSDNQQISLPPEIEKLKNITALNGKLLASLPPEIVKQGIKATFEYLPRLLKESIEHNEAKLLLVGQGDVGKTCLAKRLVFNKFIQDKTTQGIDILGWGIKAPTPKREDIKLNVWDFGGQEIYHATHQFFLTKRSVYLLVWNARKSRDYEHIYYWLHTIEAFGENSPIILVMSKLNERDEDLNMKDLKDKFPQIKSLYKVDSESGKGIPELKDAICLNSWQLPHMRTRWVGSWFKVRERLEQDGRDWIEHKEYLQICRTEELDEEQINSLDGFLHDLGVIIHFTDRLGLRDMVILKPEWATKAFYKILDTQSVRERGGILLHSELENIWDIKIYPQDVYPKLLELMNKFQLAYQLPDNRSHLVAELLPSTQPEFDWDDANNLHFYYCYDFLPAGVMTRFIVLVHQDLEIKPDGKQLCWREGAVLQREGTRAFIKVKLLERLIEIKINGDKKRELLAIIRYQFDHINNSIKKVKITKEIPCNCSTYLFSWDNIPGNDNGRLIEFLKKIFGIDWVKTAKIEKIDDGRTIRLTDENNFLSLKHDDKKTKVSLKIDDGRTDEFIAKTENGKLNIYCSTDCKHRFNYEQLFMAEKINKETVECPVSWKRVPLSSLLDGYEIKENRMKEIDEIEKRDGKNFYFDKVDTVIYSERDTHTSNITSSPVPPKIPEKKKSWVDIINITRLFKKEGK